jgi:uncharacterized protein (TIGR00645 family)
MDLKFMSDWKKNFVGEGNGLIENIILKSRYLLVPFFCAILFQIFTLAIDLLKVLVGIAQEASLTAHTLQTLELVDITMISNLVWLISAGSYYVFVHDKTETCTTRPRCLNHMSSGILKEKTAGSLVGVALVYLLQIFLHADTSIIVKLVIFALFIFALLAFNHTNKADHLSHNQEQKNKGE